MRRTRGNTILLSRTSGLMECRQCGRNWRARIKQHAKGKYYRGSWQCPNGCNKNLSR